MHSNLERLTSMLLVASAITLAGANTSAEARRFLPPQALATADSWNAPGHSRRGEVMWSAAKSGWDTRRHGHLRYSGSDAWNVASPADGGWGGVGSGWGSESASAWGGEGVTTHAARAGRTRVASLGHANFGTSRGGADVVAEARRWIGTNPTGWSHVWCGRFMNFVLERTGRHGTGSNLAFSFAHYGSRIWGPQVGAIAVMGRRGGGHVGVVSGIDSAGNPIIISGNVGHRVVEGAFPRSRIVAYVMP